MDLQQLYDELVLRESQLRATLYSIGDAVIATDRDGQITMMNPVAERLTGWTEADALGRPVSDVFRIVHEETRAEVENPVTRVVREGIVIGLANHSLLLSRDGREYPIADAGAPIRNAAGEITGVVLVFRDQTAERQVQRALQHAREFAESIIATIREPLLVLDPELRVVMANRAFYRTFRVAPEETEGRFVYELGNRQWDIPELRRLLEDILPQNTSFEDFEVEHDFEHIGRRTMQLNARRLYREKNKTQLILLAIEDVTERKRALEALQRSEQQYRSLFETVPEVVYSLSPDGRFTMLNPAFERITGWAVEDWLGRPFDELIHPEDREMARQEFARALRGETSHFREMRVLTRSGQTLVVEVLGVAHIQNGRSVGVTGFAHDVTERKQLERQLLQAQKMEAIGRLAGGIAHDFNNLLTVIAGYAEMALLHPGETDLQRRYITEIKKAADRATGLTRQLLAFSRQQLGEPRPINLNDVIAETKQMLHRIIGEDIQMDILLEPDAGCVKADPLQMQQVILNLVVNARDAMPRGGKLTLQTATVVLKQESELTSLGLRPGSYVRLTVADTGCGMDEETMSRIFEPFFTTKEEGKGTGLGLSTVYGIVKQSGGEITVTSEVGQGTTFTIYLPQVTEPSTDSSRTQQEEISSDMPVGSETILLVEDEPAVRQVAQTVLEACGYQVIVAETPRAAVQLLAQGDPAVHLLLTDVVMPEMSGPELAERVAALRPEVKVLYMSGYTERTSAQHILEPGVNFILKPFTPRELACAVRRVLDRP
ncbi:MAG TPA: PAS domain S-box protein [Blastocatellia bacterium]|nr:PAS domain S-box protein [Blastocatellia bacterium]